MSFISLKLVLPAIGKLLRPRARLLALIKPQFEAGRGEIKKGIVRDAGSSSRRYATTSPHFWPRTAGASAAACHRRSSAATAIAEFFIEAERG